MKRQITQTVSLGDLILTVFDKAAAYRLAPTALSSLVTQTVERMLLRGRNFDRPTAGLASAALGQGD